MALRSLGPSKKKKRNFYLNKERIVLPFELFFSILLP